LAIAEAAEAEQREAQLAAQKVQELVATREVALTRLRGKQERKALQNIKRAAVLQERIELAKCFGKKKGEQAAQALQRVAQIKATQKADAFALEAELLSVDNHASRRRWTKALGVMSLFGLALGILTGLSVYEGSHKGAARDQKARVELERITDEKDKRLAQLATESANHKVLRELEIVALDGQLAHAQRAEANATASVKKLALAKKIPRSKKLQIHHGAGPVMPLHTKAVETTAARSPVVSGYDCLAGDPMCMNF
jgi:hypothetical protein